jgi:hypothetical protein
VIISSSVARHNRIDRPDENLPVATSLLQSQRLAQHRNRFGLLSPRDRRGLDEG